MNEINACTKFQLAVPDLLTSRLNLTLGNLFSSNLEVPPEYQVVDVTLLLVDSQKILMTIEVRRLSGIYFLTLFIPSLCLITAASLTLFIGKTHFEVNIQVWPPTQLFFCLLSLKKSLICMEGRSMNSRQEDMLFLPTISSGQTLEGLFELTRHPSRSLCLASCVTS